ncbi:MAG: Gfo/Idh/MocA family protein [Saprospiraceae bacterium]
MPNTPSRRKFLRQAALATGTLAVGTSASAAPTPITLERSRKERFGPNDQVNLGLIGAGGMGVEDTKTALKIPGVKVVAVCDLYDGRLEAAKDMWGKDIFTTRDYKEILARPDVDAVIIATPDHWHKEISVAAMEAGKAAYCEKPMVHSIEEGPAVIAAAKKSGKTYQVGSQGLSSLGNEKARELFRAGAIGQLVYAEGYWARNSPIGAWQYPIPKDASAKTVDWERFVSNTNNRAFDPLRFFRWRNYRDYGTGVAGDLFVHLFSSCHFILDSIGPQQIISSGGLRYWKDGREVPDVLLGMFDYAEQPGHPAFNLSLRVNFVDGTSDSTYLRLVGSEGSMDVNWNDVYLRKNLSSDPMDAFSMGKKSEDMVAKTKRKVMMPRDQVTWSAEGGYKGAHYDHFQHFFDGVREGKSVIEDATFGYRAAAPALLCNDSYFEKKVVDWDPEKMKLI